MPEAPPSRSLPEDNVGWGTPGEAASLREAPPPGPLPKSSWGSSCLFHLASLPLRLALSPLKSVEVTAADRAAAPIQRWERLVVQKSGALFPQAPPEERLGLKLALPSY